jgi:hypothetical protein
MYLSILQYNVLILKTGKIEMYYLNLKVNFIPLIYSPGSSNIVYGRLPTQTLKGVKLDILSKKRIDCLFTVRLLELLNNREFCDSHKNKQFFYDHVKTLKKHTARLRCSPLSPLFRIGEHFGTQFLALLKDVRSLSTVVFAWVFFHLTATVTARLHVNQFFFCTKYSGFDHSSDFWDELANIFALLVLYESVYNLL